MEMIQLFLYFNLYFFTKTFESLFNNLIGQDGIICDFVGWWSGLKKCVNSIDNDIDLDNTLESMGTNN